MRAAVRHFAVQKGKFVWAECGGLMYLARSLRVLPNECNNESGSLSASSGEPAQMFSPLAVADEYGKGGGAWEMCGVLPLSVGMTPALVMGYCTASLTRASADSGPADR